MEKLGPFLAYMLMFRVLLVLSRLCFPFFAVFSFFLAGIEIHDMGIHYHFLTYFWVLTTGLLRWPVVTLHLRSAPPLTQTSSYGTDNTITPFNKWISWKLKSRHGPLTFMAGYWW